MKFYHASKSSFYKPDDSYFKEDKDFGPMLYCSGDYESALDYCNERGCNYIMDFDFDLDTAYQNDLIIKEFDEYNMTEQDRAEWVREIVLNRSPDADLKNIEYCQYIDADIIIGPRADNDISEVLLNMINQRVDMLDDYVLSQYYENFKPNVYTTQYCFNAYACNIIFRNMNMNISTC